MRRQIRTTVWMCAAIFVSGMSAAAVAEPIINGQVARVGFPFSTANVHASRVGVWTPVLVELQANDIVEVDLIIEARDLDGDPTDYTLAGLTLSPGSGLERRWVYFMLRATDSLFPEPVQLNVVDKNTGSVLARLQLPDFDRLNPEVDTRYILDISNIGVGGLTALTKDQPLSETDDSQPYYRPLQLGAMRARDLPDRWYGLELVDTVVWDLPDPESEISRYQIESLLDWVRRGGHLIIGLGRQGQTVFTTLGLRDVLPVEVLENVFNTNAADLPRFRSRFGAQSLSPRRSLQIASVRPVPGAVNLFWDRISGITRPLVTTHALGSGRVTVTAAGLNQTLRAGTDPEFLELVIGLNRKPDDFRKAEADRFFLTTPLELSLAPRLHNEVGFQRRGVLSGVLVSAFAIGYVIAATLLTWFWLISRKRTSLAWPAFGVIAIAASILSLTFVSLSRGISAELKSAAILDLDPATGQAHARAWFGYRAPRRERAQFVPQADPLHATTDDATSFLRPLTPDGPTQSYTAPLRYVADVQRATLEQVPIRATLKQFEGAWSGMLTNTVAANLTVDRRTARLTPESWITNQLPGTIKSGYLLYLDPRLTGAPAVDSQYVGVSAALAPVSERVLILPLPELEPDTRVGDLGTQVYEQLDDATQRAIARPGAPLPKLPDLRAQRFADDWLGLSSDFHSTALYLSVADLILPTQRASRVDQYGGFPKITGVPANLDVSNWLTEGRAVLLLESDDPPPIGLLRDQEAFLRPTTGRTLYRVIVPLAYTDATLSAAIPSPARATGVQP